MAKQVLYIDAVLTTDKPMTRAHKRAVVKYLRENYQVFVEEDVNSLDEEVVTGYPSIKVSKVSVSIGDDE